MCVKLNMTDQPILTLSEAAAYLRLHIMTLYRLSKKKKIPLFKVGGRWRIRKDDLEKWIIKNSR